MSTVIVSLTLIAAVILLFFFFSFLNKQNKKKQHQKLISIFNSTGVKHGLSFSSQEILGHKIVGLDGINRKFVTVNDKEETNIISLDEVRICEMKKNYQSYQPANQSDYGHETFVTSVVLHFEFKTKKPSLSIVFYDNLLQPVVEEKIMEAKAKDWEIILSKMIASREKVRA